MVFAYLPPDAAGRLRQGELLGNYFEHQSLGVPTHLSEGEGVDFEPVLHPLLLVMTADCDLLWDYEARDNASDRAGGEEIGLGAYVPHVLLVEAFRHAEIRNRDEINSDLWRRIKQNQDERYHHMGARMWLDDLFIDFKKCVGLPTRSIYRGIRAGTITRMAVVPDVFLHDVMHRFYGFLSRVAVPDGDD